MLGTANGISGEPQRILALALILAFLSASATCEAMVSIPIASAHPCCPNHGQPDPDRCAKAGCISTFPVLPPESVASTLEFPVVALIEDDSIAENSLPGWNVVPILRSPNFELSLSHHQLLI